MLAGKMFIKLMKYRQSLQVLKVALMPKCLKPVFFQMASRGQLPWFNEKTWLYVSLWENDSESNENSHLTYYTSKQFPNRFRDLSNILKSTVCDFL